MFRSFSTKTPLYFVAAGEDDLFNTRSNQSEFKPERNQRRVSDLFNGRAFYVTIFVSNPWRAEVKKMLAIKASSDNNHLTHLCCWQERRVSRGLAKPNNRFRCNRGTEESCRGRVGCSCGGLVKTRGFVPFPRL